MAILFLVCPSKLGLFKKIEMNESEKSKRSFCEMFADFVNWFFLPKSFIVLIKEFLRAFSWEPPSGVSIVLQNDKKEELSISLKET